MSSHAIGRNALIKSMVLAVAILFQFVPCASEENKPAIDDAINRVDKKLQYLKSRSIDVSQQEKGFIVIKSELEKYRGWLSRLEGMKEGPEKEDAARETGTMRQVIDLSLSSIEINLQDKIASIRRLDMLYLLTAVAGIGFVIGITFYTIWMYLKRR